MRNEIRKQNGVNVNEKITTTLKKKQSTEMAQNR